VATLRRAARERAGPPPSIDVADALLDERRELIERATRQLTGDVEVVDDLPASGFKPASDTIRISG
jgi:hypothetical protein